MTPEKARELLPIIQAYAEGEPIQECDAGLNNWRDCIDEPEFENECLEFRIKPEPKVIYVNELCDGNKVGFDTTDGAKAHAGACLARCKRVAIKYIEASD